VSSFLQKETYVICPNGINLFDLIGECERLVEDEVQEFVGGGFAGQQFKLVVDGSAPSNDDSKCDL
jgi:hypothetical protein